MDKNMSILAQKAVEAKDDAYCPYSGFHVGAALLTAEGRIYTGANIENSSFGATCCAERTAIFKAVSEGCRKLEAIAVASDSADYVLPCGICRQVMAEFAGDDLKVISCKNNGEYRIYTLGQLLPNAFRDFKDSVRDFKD